MAKPILYFKVRSMPSVEDFNKAKQLLGNDYYLIFMQTGQGENESVKILSKGRDSKTVTKHLKRLINHA